MANRVKTISKYSGSAWGTEVPIGADATNVDMTTAPSDYDSSSSETSKVLIGTNDVKVIASDTDLTAWGKFNRFRRRVSNKFADYFATANIKTSYQTTGANGDVYSTSLLNSYFSNVIGYTGSSAPTAGSVASQLESLNSKTLDIEHRKLLWTNPNPGSAITTLWIGITNLDSYKDIEIFYKSANVYSGINNVRGLYTDRAYLTLSFNLGTTGEFTGNTAVGLRTAAMQSDGIQMAQAVILKPAGQEVNHNLCIPTHIFGINY